MKKLGIDVINISSPAADQRMIASNRDFFYKKFVPADYNVTLLNSDGASQDRMTGKIKLFCAGYGENTDQNFGSKGNGTFQQETVSAIEAVIYPVVMMINKINGVSFADQPAEAERRSRAAGRDPGRKKRR